MNEVQYGLKICLLLIVAACTENEQVDNEQVDKPVVVNVILYEAAKVAVSRAPANKEVVRTYSLDRTYYDSETKPGGSFYEKVKNMMNLVEPGKVHVFFVNGKRLSIRVNESNIKRYDALVSEMLCTTEVTGQKCEPIVE